jgi:hypothetical protein
MESINLTIEELDQIKAIQEKYTQLTTAFGQIEIAQETLTSQKEALKKALTTFKEQEMEFGKALQEKYGVGNINLETGEFTKVEAQ